MARWWTDNPSERYWLEATDRTDIGRDLRAPLADSSGRENWRYTLFREAKPGDVVYHYDSREAHAIIGWSRIAGPAREAPIVWAARGSYARERGAEPSELPGYAVPLIDFTTLQAPLTLAQLRADKTELIALTAREEELGKKPLYFPFELSESRDVRPLQGYAFKLPAAFVDRYPTLGGAAARADRASPSTTRLLRVRDITDHLGWLDQVYGNNLEDAPVLSFPRGSRTTPNVAINVLATLNWRRDFVVQYVTRNSATERYAHLKGRLSGIVAFYDFGGDYRDYINPNGVYEMDMSQWPDVAPLREAYRFVDPPLFDEAIDPDWRSIVQTARGRVGRLQPRVYDAISELEVEPVLNLYRSPMLMQELAKREALVAELGGGASYVDFTMSRSTEKAGWVYALDLPSYPGRMKIGHSLNVAYRRAQLSTAVPEDFSIVRAVFFPDRAIAEKAMHRALADVRVRQDREWFTVERERALEVFDKIAAELGGRG